MTTNDKSQGVYESSLSSGSALQPQRSSMAFALHTYLFSILGTTSSSNLPHHVKTIAWNWTEWASLSWFTIANNKKIYRKATFLHSHGPLLRCGNSQCNWSQFTAKHFGRQRCLFEHFKRIKQYSAFKKHYFCFKVVLSL